MLSVGDYLPDISGLEPTDGPIIIHTVNAFGTETCDNCINVIETFHLAHPDIPVYPLTKQDLAKIAAEEAKSGRSVTHTRLTIDQETAIDLGVALAPGANADEEFWPTALRRSLIVVGENGLIIHIQEPDDQEQEPDFLQAFEVVESAIRS